MKRREVGKVAWASALDWWKNLDPGRLLRSSSLVNLGVARMWGNSEEVSLKKHFHQCSSSQHGFHLDVEHDDFKVALTLGFWGSSQFRILGCELRSRFLSSLLLYLPDLEP
jgi:hypothetical protein